MGDRLNGGYFLTTIFRVAVPFFFVFSSYVFFSKNSSISKYVKRLLMLEVAWTILESPFIAYTYFVASGNSFFISFLNLIKGMLFGETYLGSWFIHASWMGMVVVYWLSKSPKYLQMSLSILFFVLALLDTSYQYVVINVGLSEVWSSLNKVIYPSESFMVAYPYMLIGKCIADSHSEQCRRVFYWLPLSSILLLVEALVCRHLCGSTIEYILNPRFEVFLCLPLVAYFLVKLSLSLQTPINIEVSKYLRNMSILMYLSHRLLMIFIFKAGIEAEGVIFFLMTILASSLFSWSLIKLSNKLPFLKYLF